MRSHSSTIGLKIPLDGSIALPCHVPPNGLNCMAVSPKEIQISKLLSKLIQEEDVLINS